MVGGVGFLISFFFLAATAGVATAAAAAVAGTAEEPAEAVDGAVLLLGGEDTVTSSRSAAAASARPGDITAAVDDSPLRLLAREGVAARSLVDDPSTALNKRPLDDDDDDGSSAVAPAVLLPLPLALFVLLGLSLPRQLNIVACVWYPNSNEGLPGPIPKVSSSVSVDAAISAIRFSISDKLRIKLKHNSRSMNEPKKNSSSAGSAAVSPVAVAHAVLSMRHVIEIALGMYINVLVFSTFWTLARDNRTRVSGHPENAR